jgi:hypothetical protein
MTSTVKRPFVKHKIQVPRSATDDEHKEPRREQAIQAPHRDVPITLPTVKFLQKK